MTRRRGRETRETELTAYVAVEELAFGEGAPHRIRYVGRHVVISVDGAAYEGDVQRSGCVVIDKSADKR